MEVLINILQMIACLTLLVGLHEWGHMASAKYFKMRVEKFYIGFPPTLFSRKVGDTVYGIGSVPLGGFVKISGMIDESLDTENLKSEPKEWEFRSKPAWQRLIVMLGGIVMNILTGIVIFIALTYVYGEKYEPVSQVNRYGITPRTLGYEIGLLPGDKIIKINGKSFENFSDIYKPAFLLEAGSRYTIERNGQEVDIPLGADFFEKLNSKEYRGEFLEVNRLFKVGEVRKDMPAGEMGLQTGDLIIEFQDTAVKFFSDFSIRKQNYALKTVNLKVLRGSDTLSLSGELGFDASLGFVPVFDIELAVKEYGFWESVPIGTARAFGILDVQRKALGMMATGEISASKNLSSILRITMIFGGEWNAQQFWLITATLSMVLALMNLLPIPALDGGHVMFLLFEIVSGRTPSDKFMLRAQQIGIILLLLLMFFAIFNDISYFLR
jgi:regulator of sigma E protease